MKYQKITFPVWSFKKYRPSKLESWAQNLGLLNLIKVLPKTKKTTSLRWQFDQVDQNGLCAWMLNCFSRVWPFLTLCNPKDCSPPGSSVHGNLQARILKWVAMPSSSGSSPPKDWTRVSCIILLQLMQDGTDTYINMWVILTCFMCVLYIIYYIIYIISYILIYSHIDVLVTLVYIYILIYTPFLRAKLSVWSRNTY